MSQIAELHDEQQPGHRIELFGWSAHLRIKVFRQLPGWHQLENRTAKQMLPTTRQSPIRDRREDVGKDVESLRLSWIFQITH